MSKRSKIVLISVMAVAILAIGSCAVFMGGLINGTAQLGPIRNVSSAYPDIAFAHSESPEELLFEDGEGGYKSTEEAMEQSAYLKVEEEEAAELDRIYDRSDEFYRFEDKNAATVFCFAKNKSGNHLLMSCIFDKDNSGYSELRYIFYDMADPNETRPWTYEPEDRVAESVVSQAVMWRGYARANDGQPTYLGVLEDESVYDLRILGEAPTEIIKTEYEGQTYYFWYYVGYDFRQELLDYPDFTFSDFTRAQVIDILDINFDG